ncbi:hypothetical protein [Curtobacterium oceanosedimentum]|uniref:Uncharacterized protein n=1 Tax=Curtobacterium oceanosedimentum TaxID=465820 RepID=A0A147DQL4_9MICO|nr:hypothetical protein [Curtobacterium oceanosedimentum]KTR51833.1 hypothetical protein NS359_08395 [Curtobacterium oceanosedimentum]
MTGRPGVDARVERALAVFAAGDRRAAWESLTTMARRDPSEPAWRRALVQTYRAAGHPDQAARWGAADPGLLDDRERRLLKRAAARARTAAELRSYLALPVLPPELEALLPPRAEQRRHRSEPLADGLKKGAVVVSSLLAGPAIAIGITVTLVRAFLGDPSAHDVAQVTGAGVLLSVAGVGALVLVASVLRGRWVRAALLFVAVAAAVVLLAAADMTSTTPFDRAALPWAP